jgi:hypothetical protein
MVAQARGAPWVACPGSQRKVVLASPHRLVLAVPLAYGPDRRGDPPHE